MTCYKYNFRAVFCYVTQEMGFVEKIKAMNTKFLRESALINFTRLWRLNYRDWKLSCVPGTKADDLKRPWQRIPLETM